MRTLVNDVPVWWLAVVFVGGMTSLCLGGFLLTHRFGFRSPSTGMDTMVSAFSAKANALFGILLVFVMTMFAFSTGKENLLVLMIVILGALTGAGPLVTVLLDYPFSGTIGAHPTAFYQGVLAPLVHR